MWEQPSRGIRGLPDCATVPAVHMRASAGDGLGHITASKGASGTGTKSQPGSIPGGYSPLNTTPTRLTHSQKHMGFRADCGLDQDAALLGRMRTGAEDELGKE